MYALTWRLPRGSEKIVCSIFSKEMTSPPPFSQNLYSISVVSLEYERVRMEAAAYAIKCVRDFRGHKFTVMKKSHFSGELRGNLGSANTIPGTLRRRTLSTSIFADVMMQSVCVLTWNKRRANIHEKLGKGMEVEFICAHITQRYNQIFISFTSPTPRGLKQYLSCVA